MPVPLSRTSVPVKMCRRPVPDVPPPPLHALLLSQESPGCPTKLPSHSREILQEFLHIVVSAPDHQFPSPSYFCPPWRIFHSDPSFFPETAALQNNATHNISAIIPCISSFCLFLIIFFHIHFATFPFKIAFLNLPNVTLFPTCRARLFGNSIVSLYESALFATIVP